jgi:hypothetical protein
MKKIFCIGAVVFLILTQIPVLATNIQSPTICQDIQNIPQNENIIDIGEIPDITLTSGEEIIIWENKEAGGIYEIASITIQLETTENPEQEPPIQPLGGTFYRFYTVRAKNTFGWTMFKLVAKGMFLVLGREMKYVFPSSYASVEWWCQWAWSVDYIDEWDYICSSFGQVNAEAGFEYFIGGTVELWAYIKCYTNGQAIGGGGQV